MKRLLTLLGGSLLVALLLTTPAAWAWWPVGHGIIARAAVLALPPELPAFFRAGGDQVAHTSFDPDLAKIRTTPNVSDVEGPDHYIDLEMLAGKPLPGKRYEFIALCARKNLCAGEGGAGPLFDRRIGPSDWRSPLRNTAAGRQTRSSGASA